MSSPSFQNLAALSENLNEASDLVSQQLADFEKAFNAFNLGVSAWIVLHEWDTPVNSGERTYWIKEGISIGYGKHKGKWGLLYSEWNDVQDEWHIQWLREAPREDRLTAVAKLPELLSKLEAEASKVAEDARAKAAQMKEMVGAVRALTQ
jgi:hypothetical protein